MQSGELVVFLDGDHETDERYLNFDVMQSGELVVFLDGDHETDERYLNFDVMQSGELVVFKLTNVIPEF